LRSESATGELGDDECHHWSQMIPIGSGVGTVSGHL